MFGFVVLSCLSWYFFFGFHAASRVECSVSVPALQSCCCMIETEYER